MDSSSSNSRQIEADIEPAAATSSAAAAAPWVALCARCFFVWASMLESQTARSESDTADAEQRAACAVPQSYLAALTIWFEDFTKYLKVIQLPADVRQQLERQLTAATVLFDSLQGAEAAPAVAQQLRSMGQAIAGRIPLTIACNNPSCTNLAQRSELVLVGGKSCVCARCKAAR
jgi:hypothetical protein